ncbi:PREDICTED: F-box/kelch-repeat protein At5g43190 [Camelina sativa]|uniref:F-box/kelch-repeat protein At5g43190 n=1 Tax=Camelina sativa TaxID=90675 RepID=A0ABM0UJH2_CAMSA|nr:PREDICTED: F-box/kelch-repeat protein At5g43190 [Camelina sativa]
MFRLRAHGKKPITITTTTTTSSTASDFLYWSPESSPTALSSPRDMDPTIWSNLPNHLLDHILSFLPFKTLISLRSISRHLRSLILSPSFLSDHSSFSLPSFLLLSHPQSFNSFPLFNPNLISWCTLPLPRSLSVTCASSLLSSSHGLLCFSRSTSSVSSLSIFNPLTRSSRSIKFPSYSFPFELLSLVTSPDGYKIFTLCPSSSAASSRSVCLYDSSDRTWRKFGGVDQVLPRGFNQDGVFYNGSLYFARSEPFLIVSVDLNDGKWTTTATGHGVFPAEDHITFARLVSDPEKKILYMVGGIGSNGICRSIKIWEFKDETESWIETETLPDIVCRKFTSVCYHNYEHVYCLWHKEMICVCCYNWPEILFFHVGRRTWHWVPKCPSLPEKWSCGFRWFSFVPSLSASV